MKGLHNEHTQTMVPFLSGSVSVGLSLCQSQSVHCVSEGSCTSTTSAWQSTSQPQKSTASMRGSSIVRQHSRTGAIQVVDVLWLTAWELDRQLSQGVSCLAQWSTDKSSTEKKSTENHGYIQRLNLTTLLNTKVEPKITLNCKYGEKRNQIKTCQTEQY